MNIIFIIYLLYSIFIDILLCEYNKELDELWNKTKNKKEFFEYFNKQNFSWKGKVYSHKPQYYGTDLNMDFVGTLNIVSNEHLSADDLPINFDARDKWNNCSTISKVRNQGRCSTCWAFSSANTMSDRHCIHEGVNVDLSVQDLQCCENCWNHAFHPNMCKGGGNLHYSFEYWNTTGIVTTDCKAYDMDKLEFGNCTNVCDKNNINYEKDRRKGKTFYKVFGNDLEIKKELFYKGPIAAGFRTYTDFSYYREGVYEHLFGEIDGGHGVRVIGYGVEDGVEYWLVANSWGDFWGEEGFFKVKRFDKCLNFETGLYTGIP